MKPTKTSTAMLEASDALADQMDALSFAEPVALVYNPLRYAREAWAQYVTRFGRGRRRVLFLGMNPGPFGMAQTGIPFGEIAAVRDWMEIQASIGRPPQEHTKRPVLGFDCPRSEVSGQRLWGLFAERFGTPEKFFAEHFVANFCPLLFLEVSGRNRTPDKLPKAEREPLIAACDAHLRRVAELLKPEVVVGVGKYAEGCAQRVLGDVARIESVLHPSPASPKANRGWAGFAVKELEDAGVL